LEGLFDFVFVLIVDLGKVGEGKRGDSYQLAAYWRAKVRRGGRW
jgi:hypothetical protein